MEEEIVPWILIQTHLLPPYMLQMGVVDFFQKFSETLHSLLYIRTQVLSFVGVDLAWLETQYREQTLSSTQTLSLLNDRSDTEDILVVLMAKRHYLVSYRFNMVNYFLFACRELL